MKLSRYFFLTEINKEYIGRIREKVCNISLTTNENPKILNISEFEKIVPPSP